MGDIPSTIPADEVIGGASPAPADLPFSIPADEVDYSSGRPRITIHPHTTIPEDASPTETIQNSFTAAVADQENNTLAARQHTSPYISDYKNEDSLGYASMNDAGEVTYKDDKGKAQPTDAKKHVVLRTPDGAYTVFNRTDKTDKGPINSVLLGLGHMVTEGFATGGLQTGAPIAGGEVAAAAARQGIKVPQGLVSPSDASKSATIMTAKVPWAGQPLRDAAGQVAPQIEQRAGQVAESMSPGGVMSPAEAGAHLRNALTDYLAPESKAVPGAPNLASTVTDEYKAVEPLIDQNTYTSLDGTRKVVFDLTKKYVDAGLATVDKDGNITTKSKALNFIAGPLRQAFINAKGGTGFDYQTTKFLRQFVGKMIDNPGEYAEGITPQELKNLYGHITDDMRDLIQRADKTKMLPKTVAGAQSQTARLASGGPNAVDAWDQANEQAKAAGKIRGQLQPIKDLGRDEQLFSKVQDLASSKRGGGVEQLGLIKNGMTPGEWKNVGAAVVSRLGLNRDGVFDPQVFYHSFSGLSEEGKNLLFGMGTQYRRDLEDIAKVSGATKSIAKVAETGGHGAGLFGGLAVLEAAEQIRQMGSLGEVVAHVAALVPAMLGTRMFANMLSNPASTRTVARWMRATSGLDTTPMNLARFNRASKTLINDVQNRIDTGQEGVVQSLQKTIQAVLEKAAGK